MHNEPDVPNPDQPAPDAAAPPADPPAVDLEAGALSAMNEALSTVDTPVDPPAGDAPPADDAPPAAGDPPADAPPTDDAPPAEGADAPPADAPSLTAEEEATQLGVKNDRARERFVELRAQAEKLKDIETRLPEIESRAAQYDQMLGHIEATGATPQQYQSALAYVQAVNKGTPEQLAEVRAVLAKELEWLDQKIGRGADAYAAHQDLADAVKAGEIDPKYADQLAHARNLEQASQHHRHQQATQAEQMQRLQQQELDQAKADIDALGERLKADPQYQQKIAAAVEKFRQRQASLPPRQWAMELALDYQSVQLAPAAPTAPAARPPVGAVPLRPQGGGGGMNRVATSPEEAMELALSAHASGRT